MDTAFVVRKALDLWNQGKLDEYLACFDPGVEWEMPGGRGQGLKGMPQALAAQLAAIPGYRFAVRQIVTDGDMAAVETTATGINTGNIRLPNGTVRLATGKSVFRAMVLMMRVSNGRICEFREYSNHPSWDVQLAESQ